MTAQLLDGRTLADEMRSVLRDEASRFVATHGRPAHLALIAVGDDPSGALFGRQVQRACRDVGVATSWIAFAADAAESAVRSRVAQASDDDAIDGVVLLLPLPAGIRQRIVTEVLSPAKDVDGLGPRNAGNLMLGFPSFVPGTAQAAMTLLRHAQIPLRGQHAVVVGRSTVGGKPVALQFLRQDATVTICHSRTRDLPAIARTADILFVSVGQPGTITGEMVRPDCVVLDAGINATPAGIVGDVDFASVREVAGWLTPVPGGLGPLTHLMVIHHTLLGPLP
jgi:methylenetetrahydrofolate dehydrogenase (NADP+)/methenyltetrahydrofolate cyclohydrolase